MSNIKTYWRNFDCCCAQKKSSHLDASMPVDAKKHFFASGFLCPDALMLRRPLIKIDWNYFLFMPCSLLCIDKTPRFLDAIAFPLLILFTYSMWSTFRLFSSLLFYWCCKAALIRRDGWSTYARCFRRKKIWKHRTDNLLDIFPGVMLTCSVVFWTTHAVSVGGKVQGWGSQNAPPLPSTSRQGQPNTS